ncbi:MAG: leucyl aminopeptidase family protein [Bacteroidales bacterium]
MNIKVYKTNAIEADRPLVLITSKGSEINASYFNEKEYAYLQNRIAKNDSFITLYQLHRLVFVVLLDYSRDSYLVWEEARKAGYRVQSLLNDHDLDNVVITHLQSDNQALLALTEGLLLGAYRFVKYFTKADEKKSKIREIALYAQDLQENEINQLVQVVAQVYRVRDLVNEPVSYLNAERLAEEIREMCIQQGCQVEILRKSQIEALKMGGLLAVNKGSVDPPTFTIVEWKPEQPINSNPYVLVGKGVVYDTGGLSLKPTTDSMDYMKSDMSGAAIVAGTVAAIAANKLPIHIVALIPATDNRPSGNAYAPGDVVTIMDGTTVEVLNSDAEGRMILADALVYAQRYNPVLVIDVATLTGSASMAIGPYALVAMGTASNEIKQQLQHSAYAVYERIVEFPLWDEYDELIKSDIADIKNVGGKNAGAIVGGKFLQRFVKYPWMHFDIAGVAFSKSNDNYRGKGGTGFGVRLLYHFFAQLAQH